MNILVTGGAGFIGSHLVEYHLAKNDRVTVIDNLSTGSLKNLQFPGMNYKTLNFIEANILDCPQLEDAVASADRIYHMAAVLGVYRVLAEPIEVLTVNMTGTQKLLETIVKTRSKARLMIASSSSAYGNSSKPMLNEKDSLIISPNTHPLWGYAVSKIADEALALAFFQKHQLPLTLVRLFNTIGPRQTGLYGMVVPRFVKQACQGKPITVYGDGTQTRSFCDVRDSIAALDLLADSKESIGEVVNVGYDREISINSLADIVIKHAHSRSPIQHIPYKEAYGKDFMDIAQRRPDISKLKLLTGFEHRWTLEDTIDNLINMNTAAVA